MYLDSKKGKRDNVELAETEDRMVVARGWGVGEMGRYSSKGTNVYL